jgi:hypothetical protein
MDQWNSKAEALLTCRCPDRSNSIIDGKPIVIVYHEPICPSGYWSVVAAELRKMGEDFEKLSKETVIWVDATVEKQAEIAKLKAERDAAYLTGLEKAVEMIKHVNPGGRFHWEGHADDAIEPIQSRIDELKAGK